ncbi:MAG: Holliday junction resolvase RuvX [Acidobacteria bacterium 21-70-11]|nr:MAG: Holliday junction resolvase RuvX [Acidobacteria bacterium 21-70-11]HQT95900.1 Holliday junction resolvase RuvX [Thermoanaerobaculaceae bacterium]HQU34133.1 Holliday junction resolvase RuvX [Thermoanaerobaculaceae bacterium]
MRWLALDVGSRRVGVAVCDADERVASPLRALDYTGPEGLAGAVAALVRTWEADGIVVGVPVTRSGQGRGERRVAGLVAALRRALAIPIETADESGTTRAAEELLVAAGVPRRRWPDLVDGIAARLILERHLKTRLGSLSQR